jgi:hypothetical protein
VPDRLEFRTLKAPQDSSSALLQIKDAAASMPAETKVRISDRYVSRLLRLAWLAPEVLERLVVHREPSTIVSVWPDRYPPLIRIR